MADENDRSRGFAGPDGLLHDFPDGNEPFLPDFSRQGGEVLGRGSGGGTYTPKKGKKDQREKKFLPNQPVSSPCDPHV
jgi:hypothetical protein